MTTETFSFIAAKGICYLIQINNQSFAFFQTSLDWFWRVGLDSVPIWRSIIICNQSNNISERYGYREVKIRVWTKITSGLPHWPPCGKAIVLNYRDGIFEWCLSQAYNPGDNFIAINDEALTYTNCNVEII